jgi:YihY family inner membrane protein
MVQHMSKADLVTSPRELAQSRIELLKAFGARLLPSLRYLSATQVHAYAFSIAANVYLSFFPFTLLLLTVCRRWLRWESAYRVILELLRIHLPAGADSIIRNLSQLAQARSRLQLISVVVLFFTSSGVFLPLEVALNQVWGIPRNRSFLRNQAMSFFLAVTAGLMAFLSILLSTAAEWVLSLTLGWIPYHGVVAAVSRVVMETLSVPLAVSICFVIYFFLPNGRVPVIRVLPAAMIGGILTEVGKVIYMQTLPLFRFREVYGPYAVSATLLFWAYGAALILLFGAHFCAHGPGIRAQPGVVGVERA